MDEHDTGRVAMRICGALLSLMRERGLATDGEVKGLARTIEREAASAHAEEQADMLHAAEWLRRSMGATSD